MTAITHYTYHEISRGGLAERVRLDTEPGKQRDTMALMLLSNRASRPLTWAAGMNIFADLSQSVHGIATLGFSAAYDMCPKDERGTVVPLITRNQAVYSMAVAVSPQKQPWYALGSAYLNVFLQCPSECYFASIGDIPEQPPWAAGFAWPCAEALGEKGSLTLLRYAQIAAATAINHCFDVYVADAESNASTDEENPEGGGAPF